MKMGIRKRFFSICLAILILFSMVPAMTFTAGALDTTVDFESATYGAKSFTSGATTFNLSPYDNTYSVGFTVNQLSGCGYNSSNQFIDTYGYGAGTFLITANSRFNIKSLYLYPSTYTQGDFNQTSGVNVTFTGKLGGSTVFTYTPDSSLFASADWNNAINKGFSLIDFSVPGYNLSAIDELDITVSNPTVYFAIDDFKFSPAAPTTTTYAATSVTASGATLNGTVNANDASTAVTFEYGMTTGYGSTVTAAQSPLTGTSNTSVSASITGLAASTTYHYRVKGVSTNGTTYGGDMTFTTSANAAPVASAVAISGTAKVGQTLTGSYTYSDAESDPQGTSTFKWYSYTDTSGNGETLLGTSSTYTLTSSELGKYIRFEVTPVAATGTSPGTAVKSNYTAAVTAEVVPFYIGNAMHYADSNDALYTSAPLTTKIDNITMEAWVKADTLSTDLTNIRIMYNGNSGSRGYGIYLSGANKMPCVLMGNVGFLFPTDSSTLNTGEWCHLAAVRDNGVWKLYINGIEKTLGSNTLAPNSILDTDTFSVGNSSVANENFTGKIDEVRFWEVARTAQQIRDNMYIKLNGDETGLVAYYNFDQSGIIAGGNNTSITSVTDVAGGNQNLTITGFALTGETSNFVSSVQLGQFQFENASYNVLENAGSVSVAITRTGGSEGEVIVNYSTQDGTAAAGSNYTSTSGSVVFVSGEIKKEISIPILNNGISEAKNFTIKMNAAQGVDIGATNSATINIGVAPNAAPVASAVAISGTAKVGQTLTGSYTYSDAESDPQGTSTFKWYSYTDTSGNGETLLGTSSTYTLTSSELGKYIRFEVTPVAATGTSPGTAVKSNYTAAVTAVAGSGNYTYYGKPSAICKVSNGDLYYAFPEIGPVRGGIDVHDYKIYKWSAASNTFSLVTGINARIGLDQLNDYYDGIAMAIDSSGLLNIAILEKGSFQEGSNWYSYSKGVYFGVYNTNTSAWVSGFTGIETESSVPTSTLDHHNYYQSVKLNVNSSGAATIAYIKWNNEDSFNYHIKVQTGSNSNTTWSATDLTLGAQGDIGALLCDSAGKFSIVYTTNASAGYNIKVTSAPYASSVTVVDGSIRCYNYYGSVIDPSDKIYILYGDYDLGGCGIVSNTGSAGAWESTAAGASDFLTSSSAVSGLTIDSDGNMFFIANTYGTDYNPNGYYFYKKASGSSTWTKGLTNVTELNKLIPSATPSIYCDIIFPIIPSAGNLMAQYFDGTTSYTAGYVTNTQSYFFPASSPAPTATTVAATSVTSSAATLNGTVNANNASTVVTFDYGTSKSYGSSVTAAQSPVTGTSATSVSYALTELTPNTTYHYRVKAINTAGITYGDDLTFTTNTGAPSVTTGDITNVTTTSASVGGNVTSDNGEGITARGLVYSTTHNPTISNTKVDDAGTATGTYTLQVSGLQPGTKYYVRAYASNAKGVSYGEEKDFTTSAITVTIAPETALLEHNLNTNSLNVTISGTTFVSTLTLSDFRLDNAPAGLTIASVERKSDTTCVVNLAYTDADNDFDSDIPNFSLSVYGYEFPEQTTDFITSNTLTITATTETAPSVTTGQAGSITGTSASLAGVITADGGEDITERGMVISKTPGPLINGAGVTKAISSDITTTFTAGVSSLDYGTLYYYKAYATNRVGTSYGNEETFTTTARVTTPVPAVPSGTTIKKNTSITLTSETNATIYYTTDGSDPTSASDSVTSGAAVTLDGDYGATVTLKAYAVLSGKIDSAVATLSYTIQPKSTLTVVGLSAVDKTYNGSPDAELSGTAVLSGTIVPGDEVKLSGTYSASFSDKTVGDDKAVTVSGYTLTGSDAQYYTLTQPTGLKADIMRKTISIDAVSISDKNYDGTKGATIANVTFKDVVSGDTVTADLSGATATFSSESVANGKSVTVTGIALGGIDAGNYTLLSGTFSTTGNILPAGTVAAPSASVASGAVDKTDTVTLSTTTSGAKVYYTTDNTAPTQASNEYSAPIVITSDVKIRAIAIKTGFTDSQEVSFDYTIKAYTVTYDANDGSGTPPADTNEYAKTDIASIKDEGSLSMTGHTFLGWTLNRDGSGTVYTKDGTDNTITIGTSPVTLYARWMVNTYTVTYNANDGTVTPTSQVKVYGSTYGKGSDGVTEDAMPIPAYTGYTFLGWYDGVGATGNKITDATTVSITANQTLYARWVSNGSQGGGTVNMSGASSSSGTSGSNSSSGSTTSTSTATVSTGGQSQSVGATTTVSQSGTAVQVPISQSAVTQSGSGQNVVVSIPVPTGPYLPTIVQPSQPPSPPTPLTPAQVQQLNSPVTVTSQLNAQTLSDMQSQEVVLQIRTQDVIYTLPASQINIDAISQQIGQQVALRDISVNVTMGTASQSTAQIVADTANRNNYQVVIKPVDFNITCTNGGRTVDVSRFTGYVERTVAIPDGIDPSRITTGIVLNSDGTFSHVPTTITVIDGRYYARINSLTNSTYTLIYNPLEFSDVETHWAKTAVNDMGSRLVVSGTGDGLFSPDRNITRAEFAAIMVRALGLKKGMGENKFNDVSVSDWYCGYIETAAQYGLINGYSDGRFGPNDQITREQAMTMIARAMKLTKLDSSLSQMDVVAVLSAYSDAGSESDYAMTAIASCINAKVVSGRPDGTIAPKDFITRAEVAVIMERLLKNSDLI